MRYKNILAWTVGGLAGAFVLGNLATSAYIQHTLLRPRRRLTKSADLSDFVPEVSYSTSAVRFSSRDSVAISALVLRPDQPNGHAIIVCHGVAHNKHSGIRFVQYLLREGFTLLMIDFRNHGESNGKITTYGYFEKDDLLAAIQYLREAKDITGNIGILGASMGASIAILAAAETNDVSALVLDSPFASLIKATGEAVLRITGLPALLVCIPIKLAFVCLEKLWNFRVSDVMPSEKIKHVRCPVLLIHGSVDQRIPADHSRAIFENANNPKELWLVEDAGHLESYLVRQQEYQKKVTQFFQNNLIGCA